MALKCPECGTTAHARTSAYEAPSVKRSWYQCQNLECSCTFTALESVDTIIMKPRRNEQESDEPENHEKQKENAQSLWLCIKTVKPPANPCLIRKNAHAIPVQYRDFLYLFPGWPENA